MTYVEELEAEIARLRDEAVPLSMSMFAKVEDLERARFQQDAEIALAAIKALAERGGPKLVAREPTREMQRAGAGDEWLEQWDASPFIPDDAA